MAPEWAVLARWQWAVLANCVVGASAAAAAVAVGQWRWRARAGQLLAEGGGSGGGLLAGSASCTMTHACNGWCSCRNDDSGCSWRNVDSGSSAAQAEEEGRLVCRGAES